MIIIKFIKKFWHAIFWCVCIIAIICGGVYEYHKGLTYQATEKRIDTAKIPKEQLHQNGIIVLCYHRVTKNSKVEKLSKELSNNNQIHSYQVTLKQLKQQVEFFKKHNVEIISAQRAVEMVKNHEPIDKQYAVLTFDDFDNTTYYNAYPYLVKNHIPFTAFVVTGMTNNYDGGTALATWSEIKKMAKNPYVSFGLHTNDMHYQVDNHGVLTLSANYNAFKKDYHKSQKKLHAEIGRYSNIFAYPYGEYTPKVQEFLVKEGITTFSLENGTITNDTNLEQPLPRVMISPGTWKGAVEKWVR